MLAPMRRKPYPTDVSDEVWMYLKACLPTAKPYGRPRLHGPREILDAIFYIFKSGCAWRLLPHDLERPGKRSFITSELGVWTEPGRGCTKWCVNVCGFASGAIRNPAQA
jgi:hypothetical protein